MRIVLFLLVLIVPAFASAQTAYRDVEQRFTAEQLRESGLDTLTPAQLAALNRLLREEQAAQPVAMPALSTPSPAAATAQSADRDPGVFEGASDGPIRSRLVGRVDAWAPGTVFTLENGQQWRVLKGAMTLRAPLEATEIVVVPGVSGRWFLQVDEDLPKARVQRIR